MDEGVSGRLATGDSDPVVAVELSSEEATLQQYSWRRVSPGTRVSASRETLGRSSGIYALIRDMVRGGAVGDDVDDNGDSLNSKDEVDDENDDERFRKTSRHGDKKHYLQEHQSGAILQ